MDLSRQLIIIKGKPKTSQIESIEKGMRDDGSDCFKVAYKKGSTIYSYNVKQVVWLKDYTRIDFTKYKILVDDKPKFGISEVLQFKDDSSGAVYWRMIYNDGYINDVSFDRVKEIPSCLCDKRSSTIFDYLKEVASIDPLTDETTGERILARIYDKLTHIDSNSAAACFLDPAKYRPKLYKYADYIYPFGCNASQKTAVEAAIKHQISIIQGPPGTGKTQTILNIIANVVSQGKTVLVVSNNNSATENVKEKLEQYGLSFIVAPLGKADNKKVFIANQPVIPQEYKKWTLSAQDSSSLRGKLSRLSPLLDIVFELKNDKARLLQELDALDLEYTHFVSKNNISRNLKCSKDTSSDNIISLILKCDSIAKLDEHKPKFLVAKLINLIKWLCFKFFCIFKVGITGKIDRKNLTGFRTQLQLLFYDCRYTELEDRIDEISDCLSSHYDAEWLTETYSELSMKLFKSRIGYHYTEYPRTYFDDMKDLRQKGNDFLKQYPVVLSTTHSARSCLFGDKLYDYVIMDEASQVSNYTGLLALTCAYKAVIVGDTKQLPNVVTNESKAKMVDIIKNYKISESYDCSKYSFLQSILMVIKDAPETMLKEHYRCHPRIINFCNQQFYDGQLVIMTEDHNEKDVLYAEKTPPGNHGVGHYNQREIDIAHESILPKLKGYKSVGIITPYKVQVANFRKQIPDVEVATVHKYQGKERDAIILSVADNEIGEFADQPNLLNVAVSRAKKKFCLILTGNKQTRKGNIMDLIDYIEYNNCTVTESKLSSIFDYLYKQNTKKRIAFLKEHSHISEYDSENLMYALIQNILSSDKRFGHFNVVCHYPLIYVISDTSLLSREEFKYASNYNTHLDFIIYNGVNKKPVLAVETDGYTFHNEGTIQHQRDEMKNEILSKCGLRLLRLSTKGCGEREKIMTELNLYIEHSQSAAS